MKVHATRSRTQHQAEQDASKNKRAKVQGESGAKSAKLAAIKDFSEFCKVVREHLSVSDMRRILEANEQDSSGEGDAVVPRCEDLLFYGPLMKCQYCGGQLECTGKSYSCRGMYTPWAKCPFSTREPQRAAEPVRVPDGVGDDAVREWTESRDPRSYPMRDLQPEDAIFSGMMIALSGRLSRKHEYYKEQIQKYGGKVAKSVIGATCVVVPPSERDRGGSTGVAEALERDMLVVSEQWLLDSIGKVAAQPLEAYDIASDLVPAGHGNPLDKLEPTEAAFENLTGSVKLHGKRAVYADSGLDKVGGTVFEKEGIVYSCAFALCDQVAWLNEYCILQLIVVPPENKIHLYYKMCKIGHDRKAEERLEDFESRVDDAVAEFVRLFEVATGNEFEPWEREKKIEKQPLKFYPLDMDDGMDVRHGGLTSRQLGAVAAHSKLDPHVAFLMKLLCSQEIYRYAMVESGYDVPDLPIGMLTDLHLKRGEEELLKLAADMPSASKTDVATEMVWTEFSNKWFTLFPSTHPFVVKGAEDIANNVAAGFELIRDVNTASRLIGNLADGPSLDDPLADRYGKLGCSVKPLDANSEDYKMIVKYLEKTYEPVKVEDVSYGVSVERIYEVELQSGSGSTFDEIKKLPNKFLLWCGTRSANLMRHLQKGFMPAVCHLPVPGYMFGKAIVCTDAAAEAARYGFTAVDRPEGFLVLAVAAMGEEINEISGVPEDVKSLESKRAGVKGLGKKTTDAKEHFSWKDGITVPCGRLVPSKAAGAALEYNEYAVYNAKQTCIRFLVGVKYEEVGDAGTAAAAVTA